MSESGTEMAATYTDLEIEELLRERKPLPQNWRNRLSSRLKRGHREGSIDCTGADGNVFRLILRRNRVNHLDFSVILRCRFPCQIVCFACSAAMVGAISTPTVLRATRFMTSTYTWRPSGTNRSGRARIVTPRSPMSTVTFKVL